MRIFSHRVLYFTIRGNQLATPRELNFCEIEKKAQKYYDKKFASATDFLFLSSTYKCNFLGADNKQ